MGTLVTRQLAAGWTFGTQKAAILDLLTEAWGPFVYRKQGTNTQAFAEFPRFVNAYMMLNFVSSTTLISIDVARALEVSGTDYYPRLFKRHTLSIDISNSSETLTLICVTGPNYRLFQARAGSAVNTFYVLTLQNVPGYWGVKSRTLVGFINGRVELFEGDNPWGNYTEGQTFVAQGDKGEINVFIRSQNLPRKVNSLLPAHQVTRSIGLSTEQGSAGALPPDLVFISGTGTELPIWKPISVPKPAGAAGTDTYVVLAVASFGINYGVKVDQPWTLGGPSSPGYIVDDGVATGTDPGTGEPIPPTVIVEPHPARLATRGQVYPSPWGLPAPGTPKP